ncbi:hypothetical protein [Paraburkholderia sp. UCT31]|uniref:hypothetical protein n=1 Tax=Paraburkholderia sp. UCT31 TaxID=2615209 RepID=UPI00223C3E29|nr:hypothetical protein [Paraburkholderia sp. UCT31]
MPQAHGKLSKFVDIRDTAVEADRIGAEADQILKFAENKSAASVAVAGEEAARPAQATTKQKRGESEQMISRASQQAVSNVAAHC